MPEVIVQPKVIIRSTTDVSIIYEKPKGLTKGHCYLKLGEDRPCKDHVIIYGMRRGDGKIKSLHEFRRLADYMENTVAQSKIENLRHLFNIGIMVLDVPDSTPLFPSDLVKGSFAGLVIVSFYDKYFDIFNVDKEEIETIPELFYFELKWGSDPLPQLHIVTE